MSVRRSVAAAMAMAIICIDAPRDCVHAHIIISLVVFSLSILVKIII